MPNLCICTEHPSAPVGHIKVATLQFEDPASKKTSKPTHIINHSSQCPQSQAQLNFKKFQSQIDHQKTRKMGESLYFSRNTIIIINHTTTQKPRSDPFKYEIIGTTHGALVICINAPSNERFFLVPLIFTHIQIFEVRLLLMCSKYETQNG